MRFLIRGTLVVSALVLAVLTSPAVAWAVPPHYLRPASVVAEVDLPATHGFEVRLVVSPRSTLLVSSKTIPRLGQEGVTYLSHHPTAPGGFDDGRLDVRVGHLGRFQARFVPGRTVPEDAAPSGCKPGPTVEEGSFVGSFVFRGERGYTRAHAHRARGTVTRIGAARCAAPSPSVGPGSDGEIRLVAGDAKADTVLRASREEVSSGSKVSPTSFLVSVAEESGGLEIFHSAFLLNFHFDPGANFRTPNLGEPLTEATLEPPAPFSGSAGFHLESGGTATWAGDLAVELPGLGRVPLTGDDFQAGMCEGGSTCIGTLPPRLAPILKDEDGFGARSGTVSLVGSEATVAAN